MFQITDLQLSVLRVLWREGRATVADVQAALADERGLAQTTVATLLARLEKRGLVTRERSGRRHVFQAAVSQRQVRTALLDTLTDGVFEGDVAALVSHLLDARDVSAGDLERVRELLHRMESDAEGSDGE